MSRSPATHFDDRMFDMRKSRARTNRVAAIAASLALVIGLMPLPAVAANSDENGVAEGQPPAPTALATDSGASDPNAIDSRAGDSDAGDFDAVENGSV